MLRKLLNYRHLRQWTVLSLLIIMVFGWVLADSAFAYDRKVLFEDFTATNCPPCGSAAAAVESALEATSEIVAPIAIHLNVGNPPDPWWSQNSGDASARAQYYDVRGVPTFVIDGTVFGGSRTSAAFQNAIENAARESSPLEINLRGAIDGEDLSIDVEITSEEDLDNIKLYVALVEDHVEYNGVNNFDDHYDPMVKMYPNGNGTSFSISADETIDYTFEGSMNGLGWHELEESNLTLVCWVQASNHDVHQAQTFSFYWSVPRVVMTEWEISDADGNDNGRAEGGETVDMVVTMELPEQSMDAESCMVTLSCDDEGIELIVSTFDIGEFESGDEISNEDAPFQFTIADDFVAHPVTFTVTVNAEPKEYERVYELTFMVGWPDVLLIDETNDAEATKAMLDKFGTDPLPWADRFDIIKVVEIPDDLLAHYKVVIWHSFRVSESLFFDWAISSLEEYLDAGGVFILSSSAVTVENGDDEFFSSYLGAELVVNDGSRRLEVRGYESSESFAETNLFLGGGDAPGFPAASPIIGAVNGGVPVLYYDDDGEDIGVAAVEHVTDTYRTLVLAFPVECIGGVNNTDEREVFLDRIMHWVVNAINDVSVDDEIQPAVFSLESAYPNPFNSSTVIPFSLDKAGQIELAVYDLTGRLAARLSNEVLSAGHHEVMFNAADYNLTAGLYYVKLAASDKSAVSKMLYLR